MPQPTTPKPARKITNTPLERQSRQAQHKHASVNTPLNLQPFPARLEPTPSPLEEMTFSLYHVLEGSDGKHLTLQRAPNRTSHCLHLLCYRFVVHLFILQRQCCTLQDSGFRLPGSRFRGSGFGVRISALCPHPCPADAGGGVSCQLGERPQRDVARLLLARPHHGCSGFGSQGLGSRV
jgi:hypothetical protein